MRKRKRRSDCKQIIYELTCEATGETYIGITRFKRAQHRAVRKRFARHCSRANTEGRDWPLHVAIRTHGDESFTYQILEVVRGRLEGTAREAELINEQRPALNLQMKD